MRGFERMRELWADPRMRSAASTDAVVRQCTFAPESVLRQATAREATPVGKVRPGTLVFLGLEAARQHAPGFDIAFMTKSWAQCPAAAIVPALLRAVWQRALDDVAD
jgi:hypothetical protein